MASLVTDPSTPEPSVHRAPTIVGLLAAVTVAGLVVLMPTPEGLTTPGKHLLGVFLIALILWVTEAIPIAVTSLLVILLQPIFQVGTTGQAVAGFMSPVFFFVVAMFCIAQVVTDSGLARRFALALLARAGNESRRVVLAFMIGAAAMSGVVSDVPVAAVWMSMALPLLARAHATPGQSSLGKALMIGIPFAAFIGGVGTPAGSSINILGLFQIQQATGVEITFLQWMGMGIPMVLILTPVAWWVLVWWFPPEVATIGDTGDVETERRTLGRMSSAEIKVVALLAVMIVLWVASSWLRWIDTTLVAMAGAIAMFAPGVNLLTWPRAQRGIGWDALLLIGSVTSLGAAATATGLSTYLVGGLPDMQSWAPAAVVALISAVTVLIHLPLPINPAVVGVLVPPIAILAVSMGQSVALFTLPVVFTASCAMLLPLDAVSVITYSKGYYRMTDMLIPGAIISAVWVVVMTALAVWLAPALGLL